MRRTTIVVSGLVLLVSLGMGFIVGRFAGGGDPDAAASLIVVSRSDTPIPGITSPPGSPVSAPVVPLTGSPAAPAGPGTPMAAAASPVATPIRGMGVPWESP